LDIRVFTIALAISGIPASTIFSRICRRATLEARFPAQHHGTCWTNRIPGEEAPEIQHIEPAIDRDAELVFLVAL
jgi:hypothetical protein